MTVSVDQLLEDAAREVGLDDFGHPSFRDGLDVLLDSVTRDGDLNPMGWAFVEATTRGSLVNRLRVTDWHRQHPDLMSTPVEAPIIVVGLSRTGTTALSHLLARDPANRSLLLWEGSDSVPPPRPETYATDPRFEAAKAQGLLLYELNPDLKAVHYDPPDAAMECSVILAQHFDSLAPSTLFNVPGYDQWVLAPEHDFRPAYDYHRQVLQVLQSEHPGRWQLKYPGHGLAMDALHATYPDARFVVTHRDPVKALASVCSVARAMGAVTSDSDHTASQVARWTDLVVAMLDGVLDHRQRVGDAQFYDLDYQDLVGDPVGAVRGMYEHFDIEFPPAVEAAMRAGSEAERHGQHGQHSYALADFGLERGALDERFERYLTAFDVPKEGG